MPYMREGKCVYKENSDGGKGKLVKCHSSVAKAKAHLKALYANVEDNVLRSASMSIVKASYDKKTQTMCWRSVNSDTGEDAYGEHMSLELFEDFCRRIDENTPVPEPFDVACEEGWCGGMPYLSISHYKSANGKNVPGEPKSVYVDGEMLKSTGILYNNPLGHAVWKSLNNDLYADESDKEYDEPVRVSIGFLDFKHKHIAESEDEEDFVFERTDLTSACPKCAEGVGNKVYLAGQLVHLALTRIPANERTEVEIMKSKETSAIKTRKKDAESIVGDQANDLVEKSNALLITKSEKDIEEYAMSVRKAFYENFGNNYDLWVRSVLESSVIVMDEGELYKVGYSDSDGSISFDSRSEWQAVEIQYVAKKSKEDEGEIWRIDFEDEKRPVEETMATEKEPTAPVEEEEVAAAPAEETKEEITEPAAPVTETVGDVEQVLSAVKEALTSGDKDAIQESFDALKSVAEKKLETPEDRLVSRVGDMLDEKMAAMEERIENRVVSRIASSVVERRPENPVAPRRIPESRAVKSAPAVPAPTAAPEKKRSQIRQLAEKNVLN